MPTVPDEYDRAREYLDELFSTSDPQASCLSVVPHSLKDARDLRCHFFGCLGYNKRVKVLKDVSHPIWEELWELEALDNGSDANLNAETGAYAPTVRYTRYISALNLQAELKRIAVLRRTPALKESVRDLRNSIDKWVFDNKEHIQDVHDRRRTDSHTFGEKQPRVADRLGSQSGGPALSRPGKPISNTAGCAEREHLLPEFSKTLQEIVEEERDKKCQPLKDIALDAAGYELKRDIKARLIKLKRPARAATSSADSFMANVMVPENEQVHDEIFKGTFPDQQVSVYWLLEDKFKRVDKTNLRLERRMCPEEIRYFHIPANNMSWVEEAMAAYFDEPIAKHGHGAQFGRRTKLVLNDWCWKGQEHGSGPGSVVHNRNLRPTCEKISTDEEDLYRNHDNTQKSLVLFMPFLHWETDRRRNQTANLIEQLTDEYDLDKRETTKLWKMRRKEDRKTLPRAKKFADAASLEYQEPDYYVPRGTNSDDIFNELAGMLWAKLDRGAGDDVPPGLAHTLWRAVRDADHSSDLLVALKRVVTEVNASNVPEILHSIFYERQGNKHCRRGWRDFLYQLKAARRGRRTPHALEDIFWDVIKRARTQANNEHSTAGELRQPFGSIESRKIFQKPSEIFRGVGTDEHGILQPKALLAQVFVKAARLYEQMTTYPDQQLLEDYLFKHPPLHPRRTLDQAYFWRLRNTRLRDRDQVVYRYTNADFAHKYRPQPPTDLKNETSIAALNSRSHQAGHHDGRDNMPAEEHWAWTRHGKYEEDNGCDQCNEDIRKVSRAIMVDQLWLWVLDRNTILTCFPQRYGMSEKDPSGVHQAIRTRVKARSNPDNHVRSIFDLALIILDECFDTFFNRTKTADARPQVLDVFAESIGRVTNKQAVAFQHLWSLSERQAGSEDSVDPGLLNALLNVSLEADLQREIRDIIDELDIVLHIVQQQQDMIARFKKFAEQIMQSDIDELTAKIHKNPQTYKERQTDDAEGGFFSATATAAKQDALKILGHQKREFKSKAEVLLDEVADRIKEIEALKKSAESTAQNVNDLLGLKQQQAGIVQAYEAMKQGEETVRQGKAIMVFTVMTIVFLPLSFMTSVFGMNNVEESGGSDGSSGPVPDEIVSFWPTTFKRQILIMFTVSFGAVLVVVVPAFSPFIRAVIHSILARSFTKAITWTKVYRTWLTIGWDSKEIHDKAKADVRKMKEGVKEQMSARRLQQSEIWDGVRDPHGKLVSRIHRTPPKSNEASDNPTVRTTLNGAAMRSPSDVEKGMVK